MNPVNYLESEDARIPVSLRIQVCDRSGCVVRDKLKRIIEGGLCQENSRADEKSYQGENQAGTTRCPKVHT